jgi:hypothetical protein
MNRPCLLSRAQHGEPSKEGRHRLNLGRGHGRMGHLGGASGIAGQCVDEGASAPCGAVVAAQIGIDEPQRCGAFAADRQRQRKTLANLRIIAAAQDQGIVLLRPARIANKVVSEAAILRDFNLGRPVSNGFGEQAKRMLGLLHMDERGSHACLDARIARRGLLSPAEEGKRRLRVTERQRGSSSANQGNEAARIVGKVGEVAAQFGAGAAIGGQRLDDRARRVERLLSAGSARRRKKSSGRKQRKRRPASPPEFSHARLRARAT